MSSPHRQQRPLTNGEDKDEDSEGDSALLTSVRFCQTVDVREYSKRSQPDVCSSSRSEELKVCNILVRRLSPPPRGGDDSDESDMSGGGEDDEGEDTEMPELFSPTLQSHASSSVFSSPPPPLTRDGKKSDDHENDDAEVATEKSDSDVILLAYSVLPLTSSSGFGSTAMSSSPNTHCPLPSKAVASESASSSGGSAPSQSGAHLKTSLSKGASGSGDMTKTCSGITNFSLKSSSGSNNISARDNNNVSNSAVTSSTLQQHPSPPKAEHTTTHKAPHHRTFQHSSSHSRSESPAHMDTLLSFAAPLSNKTSPSYTSVHPHPPSTQVPNTSSPPLSQGSSPSHPSLLPASSSSSSVGVTTVQSLTAHSCPLGAHTVYSVSSSSLEAHGISTKRELLKKRSHGSGMMSSTTTTTTNRAPSASIDPIEAMLLGEKENAPDDTACAPPQSGGVEGGRGGGGGGGASGGCNPATPKTVSRVEQGHDPDDGSSSGSHTHDQLSILPDKKTDIIILDSSSSGSSLPSISTPLQARQQQQCGESLSTRKSSSCSRSSAGNSATTTPEVETVVEVPELLHKALFLFDSESKHDKGTTPYERELVKGALARSTSFSEDEDGSLSEEETWTSPECPLGVPLETGDDGSL